MTLKQQDYDNLSASGCTLSWLKGLIKWRGGDKGEGRNEGDPTETMTGKTDTKITMTNCSHKNRVSWEKKNNESQPTVGSSYNKTYGLPDAVRMDKKKKKRTVAFMSKHMVQLRVDDGNNGGIRPDCALYPVCAPTFCPAREPTTSAVFPAFCSPDDPVQLSSLSYRLKP